jgi:hypothetical protein
MAKTLEARILDVTAVDIATRRAMFAIYEQYYEPAIWAVFERDLDDKDEVLLLSDIHGALRGFSTMKTWCVETPLGRKRLLFSGDTIIEQAFWGLQALPFRWIEHAGAILAASPETPLFWFLISKGHRTYRYLNAFAHVYYPTWQQQTPTAMSALIELAGRNVFGSRYCAETGVVRADAAGARLRAEFTGIDANRRPNPETAFFLARNPGWCRGDELLCFCELSAANLKPPARAQFLKGYHGTRLGAAS